MKYLLTFIFFYGTSAFSCPELTGTYLCQIGTDTASTKIVRSLENGFYVYAIDDSKFIADDQDHAESDEISGDYKVTNKKYRTNCNGEYLNTYYTGDFYNKDVKQASFLFHFKLYLTGNTLVDDTTSTVTLNDGSIHTDAITTVCTRQ